MTRINFDCLEPLRVRQWVIEDIGIRDEPCVAVAEILFGFAGQTAIGCPTVAQLTLFPSGYPNWTTSSWEQRKLGDITSSYSGGTPQANNPDYYNGSIPFIRSAEINADKTELYLTERGLAESSAALVDAGCILYALYGATSGEAGISRINGAINQAILAICPYAGFDSGFLASWLRREKDAIVATYLQGGQGNLSVAIVKDLRVPVPGLPEQKAIGDCLSKLDDLITLHQREPRFADTG